ncbi:MAG: DNA translocase FtsK [Verrucomicrobiota bacterium]
MASVCFLLAMLVSVGFIDYSPAQSRVISTNPTETNWVGDFGAFSGYWSFYWMGLAAWLLPVFLFWLTYVSLRNARRLAVTRLIAMIACIATFAGLCAMWESYGVSQYFPHGLGGQLGNFIYRDGLKSSMGAFGSALMLGLIYSLGLLFVFTKDIAAEFEKAIHWLQTYRERRAQRQAELAELRQKQKAELEKKKTEAAKVAAMAASPAAAPTIKKLTIAKGDRDPLDRSNHPFPTATSAPSTSSLPPFSPKIVRGSAPAADAPVANPSAAIAIVKAEETKKAKAGILPVSDENYHFPQLTLLKEQTPVAEGNSDEEHVRNMGDLVRILGEFGVTVNPGEIHIGPVITCYEVAPAPGVRVEKIAGLDKNIALGMRAQSVRILAPIPGKAAVGVEIPNRTPTPVGMREILESEDWASVKAEIPIALGKDVSGKPLISDLTRMPHLLIAGATGSGKSVCINSIIASIVYRKSPRDVRLIMVDPKVVELKIFNTLPHMLIPVVTEPKKVPSALKWLLGEMEQRYQQFAKVGVRNIAGFNSRKKAGKPDFPTDAEAQQNLDGVDPLAPDDDLELPDRLPYIVAIIDELADLMMVAPAEIETSIARLAQLARAAGIHLIIATQRPSVNVITGVIKANLPSRIAFQVASQVDSRTILDGKGADTLIGRGDMLFSPPGSSRLVRAQGAFVSDEEVTEVVEFLKKNGPPQYAQSVQAQIDRDAAGDDDTGSSDPVEGEGDDEQLYRQALDVIRSTKRASTSMIQRRLRIGYNRAARIMDQMEDRGVVGPENGSSPREILVDLDSM